MTLINSKKEGVGKTRRTLVTNKEYSVILVQQTSLLWTRVAISFRSCFYIGLLKTSPVFDIDERLVQLSNTAPAAFLIASAAAKNTCGPTLTLAAPISPSSPVVNWPPSRQLTFTLPPSSSITF